MRRRLVHRHTTTPAGSRPPRSERGTLLVEAAFAIPVFLLLFLGITDLGRAALQTSQATSGAADGGRRGIVLADPPDTADCANDTSYQQIIAAVQARIPNRSLGCEHVIVACTRPDGAAVNCATADTLNDRLRVTVRWEWVSISPFGDALPIGEIRADSSMQLVPQPLPPPTTAPPVP